MTSGRNPKCYFTCNPEVTFDTRIFVDEMDRDPRIVEMLAEQCKPELEKLIRVYDLTGDADVDTNAVSSGQAKRGFRNTMRNMFY